MYFYQERTIRKDGDAMAFVARYREGPNLPRQDAVTTPAELDAFGAQIAAALNQQAAARAMLAALREMVNAYGSDDGRGPIPVIVNAEAAIAQAQAAGITEEGE